MSIKPTAIHTDYRYEIINSYCKKVLFFIEKHAQLDNKSTTVVLEKYLRTDLKSFQKYYNSFQSTKHNIVCLKRLNDFRYLNKFIEGSNGVLANDGFFIGNLETLSIRKENILKRFPKPLNYIHYYVDFILKRVLPKLHLTKKLYFSLTNGKNRVISEIEIMGRLYSCGFELLDHEEINGILWFIARKKGLPEYNLNATYGPFIKLKRHGFNNNIITVYKLRTMHPFSEFLQPYVSAKFGLQSGGKFKDDPRVTTIGKFLRKFWIDELPMILNIFKGDMKIVGVRPLSGHYFSLYPKQIQELRGNVKPGLIPPYYADLPETLEEIIDSERRYLLSYLRSPLKTDLRYFIKAIRNIFLKNVRSK